MIAIEVSKSKKIDELGSYEFAFDDIVVGSTSKCDVILSTGLASSEKIHLKIYKKDLVLETSSNYFFIHINGVKISGRLVLKQGDRVQLGEVEFKIVQYNKNPSIDDFPYEEYQKILVEELPQKQLIIEIENELNKLS